MLSRYDRMVLSLIALALAVIALNPWVAPTSSQAQGGKVDVNIVEVRGKPLLNFDMVPSMRGTDLPGLPVYILNPQNRPNR
ncbi:MAG: hypothetical protein HY618_03105 [Candidatus Tectomicrobia bacterium]|uniref:Uncharacterized protein n=1 Tax=Tectimicrobiota bacterium TaxID=2528274 RepID=A0A933E8V6_UNCTE|nr:hypothetical protein [Candidatus Tectomicrobia bacterium]MBI4251423.1 hypothetical protein [Candidatus Tectomicrobia bacterium]